MEIVAAIVFFGLCFAGLAVGVIVSDRELKGSCGGEGGEIVDRDGNVIVACGVCVKKDVDVCPTDNDLVRIGQIAHPNPKHHR
jgi:hypothetical protein